MMTITIKLLRKSRERIVTNTMTGGANLSRVGCSRSCRRFHDYEISIEFEIGGSEKKRKAGAISQINFPNINKQ